MERLWIRKSGLRYDEILKEKGEDHKKMWTDELKKTEKELNSLFIDGELHDKN